MRIDSIEVTNFKCFEQATLTLQPNFTLIAGANGVGKTSFLDALAVGLGIWLAEPPDSTLASSKRHILPKEIRLEAEQKGDRLQFREHYPVEVKCQGIIDGNSITWSRRINPGSSRTSNADANQAIKLIRNVFDRDANGENVICPVLAYYGAGRGWLPSNIRKQHTSQSHPSRRWDAFYDCFNERIRFAELHQWFRRETTAAGTRGGKMRPGFNVVRIAVLRCVPGADEVWYDSDRDEIVVSIAGKACPMSSLSAGQRMMFALIADLAIKVVTQNAFLLEEDCNLDTTSRIPRVLSETNGVVLIDELDVHLHPQWQRRVAGDLQQVFPGLQFVCTSHSPQIIGELRTEQVRLLDNGEIRIPSAALGADTNWLLDHEMGASSENQEIHELRLAAIDAIDRGDLPEAQQAIEKIKLILPSGTSALRFIEGQLEALQSLAEGDYAQNS